MKKIRELIVLDVVFHIVMIILLVVITSAILIWCGQQTMILAQLKNKCIIECFEFNKIAVESGILERCAC